MALIMLLPFPLTLLHLFAGVCVGEVEGDDPVNVRTRVFVNHYPTGNLTHDTWSNHPVILALSQKAQCMSYIAFDDNPLESLASCELYCFINGGYNTWDCIAPEIDPGNDYWNNTFTDELLFQWSPGSCSCSNSTTPTPSIFGDNDGDDSSPASPPSKLQPAIKVPNRQVRELSRYGYQIEINNNVVPHPQPNWDYARITWRHQEPGQQPGSTVIGIFAVMNNGANNQVLRVHEAWAGSDNRPSAQRATFHDDVINFWRMTPLNRNLNQLTELRFDTVIESSLSNLLPWIFETMGASIMGPLRVFRNGPGPNEQQVFERIMQRARFARSMQHAINEYVEFSGRTIEGFYFTCGYQGCDFAIYFNGYNPLTIGDSTWEWS